MTVLDSTLNFSRIPLITIPFITSFELLFIPILGEVRVALLILRRKVHFRIIGWSWAC